LAKNGWLYSNVLEVTKKQIKLMSPHKWKENNMDKYCGIYFITDSVIFRFFGMDRKLKEVTPGIYDCVVYKDKRRCSREELEKNGVIEYDHFKIDASEVPRECVGPNISKMNDVILVDTDKKTFEIKGKKIYQCLNLY